MTIISVKSVESEGVESRLVLSHDGEAAYITRKVIRPDSYAQWVYMIDGEQQDVTALIRTIGDAENGIDMRDIIDEFDYILQHVA